MSLSRLFDPGSRNWPANKRDVASIPLIIRLLKQKRCHKVLVARARLWTPEIPDLEEIHAAGCRQSIDTAINTYDSLRRSAGSRAMMRRLRDFRNKRLAHSMMQDTLKALPKFNELFKLMDVARDIAEDAKLAIAGVNMGLKDTEEIYRATADDFWRYAFNVGDGDGATASPERSRRRAAGSGR
jgi:hypothetical protein